MPTLDTILLFLAAGFLFLASLGLLAARARSVLLRNPAFVRWQEGLLGAGLLGLGTWLLADSQPHSAGQ
ncbi:MAG: hypothetical protein GVY13_14170 [Alphaproteobacteria bacterium]|jgi:threonine/homoserine/homoserine lactone efflux protein|nr:hypothetical protein [Alphaproteobacteria bacterium]